MSESMRRRAVDRCVQSACPDLDHGVRAMVTGGKMLRSSLLDRLADGHAPDGALAAVEMAHAASLLHDDVLDGEVERRGLPSLNRRLGSRRAVLEGDMLLAGANLLLAELGDVGLLAAFAGAVAATCAGEVLHQQLVQEGRTTLADYLQAVRGKTGALFGFAGFAGGRFSLEPESALLVQDLFVRLGILYQMQDDLEDVREDLIAVGDGCPCFTYPVALLAESLGGPAFSGLGPDRWMEGIVSASIIEKGRERIGKEYGELLRDLEQHEVTRKAGETIAEFF